MTRLLTSGFENFGTGDLGVNGADGLKSSGSSYSAGDGRDGSLAAKIPAGNTTDWIAMWNVDGANYVLDRTYFARVYFKYDTDQTSKQRILSLRTTTGMLASIQLHTDGTLGLWNDIATTQIGSSSTAIAKNAYVRLGLRFKIGTGSTDEVEFQLEGTTIASATGLNLTDTVTSSRLIFGPDALGFGASAGNLWWDDFALNDDQGSVENSWPRDAKIAVILPVSDLQDGTWTGGAGGTGIDLSAAISARPPAGLATGTNTSQISSADSAGDNVTSEYRVLMATYVSASIPANSVISNVHLCVLHSEDIVTGTKTGSFAMLSNPSGSYLSFTFGLDRGANANAPGVGASGTANWVWAYQIFSNPVVDQSIGPVVAIRKTDATTRVGEVCFVGAYVEYYTPDSADVANVDFSKYPRPQLH